MVVITLALLPSNLAHSLDQWKDLGYIAFVSYLCLNLSAK